MSKKRYTVTLDRVTSNVLKKNSMIQICCESLLRGVETKGDEIKLSVTEYELRELTGFLASEANHAQSKRHEKELDGIWHQSEDALYSPD